MDRHTSTRKLFSAALLGCVVFLFVAPSPSHAGSGMSVKRHNNYDQHVKERERKKRAKEYQKKREASAAKNKQRAEERAQRYRNGGRTDDEVELETFSGRTLGGACMYGAKGEVIYRPQGARCKGDPGPPAAQEQARPAPPPRRASPATAPVRPRKSKSTMIPNIRHSSPKKERCVWMNGRIAFQPKGVDCYAK